MTYEEAELAAKCKVLAWTDYPIRELGDVPREAAPVRECRVLEFDSDKYLTVRCEGITLDIKAGYVYLDKPSPTTHSEKEKR